MKLNSRNIVFTVVLIAIATITKIICAANLSLSGFSPIIAIALFSGMIIKDKQASFLMPLLALFISDVLIQILYKFGVFAFAGFYKGQFINYALILLTTLIGWALQGKKLASIATGAIIAPTLFFLLSNFSVWFFSTTHTLYSYDAKGLMACYIAALPFYKNALTATIVFLPAILAGYNYIVKAKPRLTLA